MMAAPITPPIKRAASEATQDEPAIAEGDKIYTKAALSDTYTNVQINNPKNKLKGIFRFGSLISPETKVILFQPSYPQKAPDNAAIQAATMAQPTGLEGRVCEKWERLPTDDFITPRSIIAMATSFIQVSHLCKEAPNCRL